jgi:SAM-dependent methyltransferase
LLVSPEIDRHSPSDVDAIASPSVSAPDFGDRKTAHLAGILAERHGRAVHNLLVVGCGSGHEAAVLCCELRCNVVGVDLNDAFDPQAARIAALELGDATALRFPDGAFDYVYSYHALEHIPNFRLALTEMRRVLSPGGGYCVGTPNRARLVGYLGSSNVGLADKVRWNWADWQARFRGRFRNEFGAHAGFTAEELSSELRNVFGDVTDISLDYYLAVYRQHATAVGRLNASGLGRYLFPSVYFTGTKRPDSTR